MMTTTKKKKKKKKKTEKKILQNLERLLFQQGKGFEQNICDTDDDEKMTGRRQQ
jgi:hypothetical protein